MSAIVEYGRLFTGIFFSLLLFAYLLPAGLTYLYFYVWKKDRWRSSHIQGTRYPSRRVLRREIGWSLVTVLIFSLLTVLLVELIRRGYTRVYFGWLDYGLGYLLISPFLFLFLHDTYFYWVHRFMHWRPVYRYIHRLHHRSVTPDPFTMFTFQPPEAILQYSILFLAVFLLPFHPAVLLFVIGYNVFTNCAGHSGMEFTPEKVMQHWLLKYNNTVTHHDLHHSRFHCNYSQYFNFWDRLMGTYEGGSQDGSG